MKGGINKLIAVVFSALCIALLVFVGPAQAFVVNLGGFSNASPVKGERVSTTSSIQINTNERMPLENGAGLYVDGDEVCTFDVEANDVVCDAGINVLLVSSSNGTKSYGYGYVYGDGQGYGYGYGYSDASFTYNITINTSVLSVGEHLIKLVVDAGGGQVYSSTESKINVGAYPVCSKSIGDANGDCKIDIEDLMIVVYDFGKRGPGLAGDLNNDRVVNMKDFNILFAHMNKPCTCNA